MGEQNWHKSIVNRLRDRNRIESSSYNELIQCNNRLFDSNNQLKSETLRLQIENEKLRLNQPITGSDAPRIQALEKKVLAQAEELSELHKRKGENSQHIIDLNVKIAQLQKTITDKEATLSEMNSLTNTLRAEVQLYQTSNQELKNLNTCLRDEHTALQLAFAALEDKLRKAQDENRTLVEKLMKYKSIDAERMNMENETFVRKMNDKVRRELEDAVRDGSRRSSSPLQEKGSIGDLTAFRGFTGPDGVHMELMPNGVQFRFDAHDGEVNAVRWNPVETVVATGGADRKVKLWDCGKGTLELRGTLIGSNAALNSVDFDTTGTMLIATSNDYASRVWTVTDQRLRHTLTGHSGKVMAAKFLCEPSRVVTGSHDRTLKIWDLRSKACVETKFAGSSCNDLVITDGSGSTIISGHFDKKIRFWDTRTDCSANDMLLPGKITSLDLSKDCKYLVACVRDDTIKLLDLRRNQVITTFSHDNFKVGCDWARVCFSPDTSKIAAGGADGSIYVWNINGPLETTLKEHTAAINAVSWHPFSSLLASVDRAKRCTIWASVST